MRLIISRKGFDSSRGGVPSPILRDGRLIPLPIPANKSAKASPHRFSQLRINGERIGPLVERLTHGKVRSQDKAHFDPALEVKIPAFGQVGSAQGHLKKQGVQEGDLFLFFGWFAKDDKSRSESQHTLFGWLQIGKILKGDAIKKRKSIAYHPHTHGAWDDTNTVYLATQELYLCNQQVGLPGAGLFPHWTPDLRLTAPEATSRSLWRLPKCFLPRGGPPILSWHQKRERWTDARNGTVRLRTVGRGQEFVIDASKAPGVEEWALNLISQHGCG
jgi:Nucleotide modification associated domain 3